MQALKWLNWTPKVGRNQRSLLTLNFDLEELQSVLAGQQIVLGKYERALEILENNQIRFSQLLQTTSGANIREGQLHIQLTYKRNFSALLPHTPLRNSERFFCRQLYSGLVSCGKDGHITPQLAHHWLSNEQGTIWQFFLRPNLKFHNNTDINSDQIIALFSKLKTLPEYEKELRHVSRIHAKGRNVTFELSEPDFGFAGLLSDVRYSIQPAQQIGQSNNQVIGCGPFQMVEHSDSRLRIRAFDYYHGYRTLTDTITIWHIANERNNLNQFGNTELIGQLENTKLLDESRSMCSHYLSTNNPSDNGAVNDSLKTTSQVDNSHVTRIEDGCLFLQFNHSKSIFSDNQRQVLTQLLSKQSLQKQLNQNNINIYAVPAFNFLPSWTKIESNSTVTAELPKTLSIAVYDHQALLECSIAIRQLLFSVGINCEVNIYSFADLHKKAIDKTLDEELILSSFNVDDNLPTNTFRWFYANSVLHYGLGEASSKWLDNRLTQLRQHYQIKDYLKELESIATNMVHQHWVIPLFHHRQTLHFEGILKDVSMTEWGWPEFRDVWSVDE